MSHAACSHTKHRGHYAIPITGHFISSLPFSVLFSRPAWNNALTLLFGTLLCRGKRTVCAALRIMGLSQESSFAKYHHILNRVDWSPLLASKILLNMLVKLVGTTQPLVMFLDETLERRKGPMIKAKGYYRDAVRSSRKCIVKSSGLKWLSLALAYRFPFSARCFALPFMTVLEPSKKHDQSAKKHHKTTMEWTIQMLMQVVRWLGDVPMILVGDGGFACGKLAWRCLKLKICLVSRLKMNARLYDFPDEISSKTRGRPRVKGSLLCSFKEMIQMSDLGWKEIVVEGYGNRPKKIKYISNVSLWGGDGFLPVPIRWVLVVDPEGELDQLPLMSTDVQMCPEKIIGLYIQRWNLEVTFEEVREHLGVETQRQWSDKAIARTTPVLLSLYTIVSLIANRLHEEHPIEVAQTAWYAKTDATFSDLLKAVRKTLWNHNIFFRKHDFESFRKNNYEFESSNDMEGGRIWPERGWITELIEHLAAA